MISPGTRPTAALLLAASAGLLVVPGLALAQAIGGGPRTIAYSLPE